MNRRYLLTAIFSGLFFVGLFSQYTENGHLSLNLHKGDWFIYNLHEKYSYLTRYSNDEKVLNHLSRDSRLRFRVMNTDQSGCYLLEYKKEYTITDHERDGVHEMTDSRYPEYGRRYMDMAACFLNTVSFHIRFCPENGNMEILNLDEIREGLIEYLYERGVSEDENFPNRTSAFLDEEKILKDIDFLNFYPPTGESDEWKKKNYAQRTATYSISAYEDSISSITTEVLWTERMPFGPAITYKLKGSKKVENRSGLVLKHAASTYLAREDISTAELYRDRTDVGDYRFSVKLDAYSGWLKPSSVSGQVKMKDVKFLAMVTKPSYISPEVHHRLIELSPDGNFHLPLEIENDKKFSLYFLQKYPIEKNPHIDLFMQPGDSLFFYVSGNEKIDSLSFGGRIDKDSELLNDFKDLDQFKENSYIFHVIKLGSENYSEFYSKNTEKVKNFKELLESKKHAISEEFYKLMKIELSALEQTLEMVRFLSDNTSNSKSLGKIKPGQDLVNLPQLPDYPYYNYLEAYGLYLRLYVALRQDLFQLENNGLISHRNHRMDQDIAFIELLLSGMPLYKVLNSKFSYSLTMGNLVGRQKFYFEEFMENCNNQELRNYYGKRYEIWSAYQPGNPNPFTGMNLMDMQGEIFDWSKGRDKTIVIMLYDVYTREQYFNETLFKEYGENKEDVIILRISPGYSFESWKAGNEGYSDLDYQHYFLGDIDKYLDHFFLKASHFIIDRSGHIFRIPAIHSIRSGIAAARELPAEPEEPFFTTRLLRILLGAFIGILLSFLIYRFILHRKMRKQALMHRMAELEHRAVKAQLNPHFLFNCLNSIQNMIQKGEKIRADKYLTSFALLIRKTLSNFDRERVSLAAELEFLELYIELEQMRFDFQYVLQVDDELDIHNTMIPAMLLHPIVENSIIHGLHPREGDKLLRIEVKLHKETIRIRIEDNGVGRDFINKEEFRHEGKGLEIIHSRISLLNTREPGAYKIDISDRKDEKGIATGTLVELDIRDET